MAEKGAHLTQTLQIKPSIFDYAAEESLNALLHPAAKRVVNALSLRNNNAQFLSKWFNEIFYAIHFCLQLQYLKKFGATFSENFYSLKRVSAKTARSSLTRRDIFLSLLFCSIVPYLKQKLEDIAEKAYFEIIPQEREKRRLKFYKTVISLNKNLNITLRVISFVQYLRYLSGKSDFLSPFLWASRLKLEYADEDTSNRNNLSIKNFLPQFLHRSLELSAFFLQFCQWWTTERMGSSNGLPIPPPPQVTVKAEQFAGLCPVCGRKRKFETVLTVSGFVFCFPCISEHVAAHKNCPVTALPASENNLVRLYTPS